MVKPQVGKNMKKIVLSIIIALMALSANAEERLYPVTYINFTEGAVFYLSARNPCDDGGFLGRMIWGEEKLIGCWKIEQNGDIVVDMYGKIYRGSGDKIKVRWEWIDVKKNDPLHDHEEYTVLL